MRKVGVAIAAAAALMLSACSNTASSSLFPDWKPVAGMPLEELDQIYPNESGTTEVTLNASAPTMMVSGDDLGVRSFGDTWIGPTLHVNPGGTIRMNINNRLGQGVVTNIHYHGLHVSPLGIGDNIFRTFADGKTYLSQVTLPTNHSKGTFWYHVHIHGVSDGQVMGGLSGLLIVEGLEDLLLRDGAGISQLRELALRDVQTDGEGSITMKPDPFKPSIRLVNGLYQPTFSMESNRYELWRLANLSSNMFFRLAFQDHEFNVIAEDGLPVWDVEAMEELLLPPGKRFDVVVLAGSQGEYQLQSLPYAQLAEPPPALTPIPTPSETENLAAVTVTAPTDPAAPAATLPVGLLPEEDPSDPRFGGDLSDGPAIVREEPFVFEYIPVPGQELPDGAINGVVFEAGQMPAVSPLLDTIEEWTLENATPHDHPFHIHINDFQVISVNGQPYDANGHQDIVVIPKQYENENGDVVNGKVVIRSKFTDFPGWFVFHCHILEHEDGGMMATIQVRENATDPITPPPPPPEGTAAHGAMGSDAGARA